MIIRILAAIFASVLFAFLIPIIYVLLVGVPQSLINLVWLALAGVVSGAILGAKFPKTFGFVFELIMNVLSVVGSNV